MDVLTMDPQVYRGGLPDPGQVLGPAAVGARVGLAHVSQEQASFLGGGGDDGKDDDNDEDREEDYATDDDDYNDT